MKSLRRTALALAALVVAAIVLSSTFALLIPSRWWTSLLRSELQQDLRRPVRVGKANWSLWKGFSAEDLWIGELPAYGSGTFLEARRMTARPRLLALLAGHVSLTNAKLVGVKARVLREANGRYNFSDLSGGRSTGAAPAVD